VVTASTALGDQQTSRLILRRLLRNGLLGLVGLALLVSFVLAADHYANGAEALRESGVVVSGTVIDVDDGTASGSAIVAYDVAGVRYAEHVDLGDFSGDYEVGDDVDVYYEPGHPTHMTIDDIDNQPGWTVLPMACALVVGLLFIALGLIRFTRWAIIRRHLQRAPWVIRNVIKPVPAGWPDRLAYIDEVGLVRLPIYGGLRVRAPGITARVCSAGRWSVIGSADGRWLISTRRPRSTRQATRWSGRWQGGPLPNPARMTAKG
jgi:hypothetical protein